MISIWFPYVSYVSNHVITLNISLYIYIFIDVYHMIFIISPLFLSKLQPWLRSTSWPGTGALQKRCRSRESLCRGRSWSWGNSQRMAKVVEINFQQVGLIVIDHYLSRIFVHVFYGRRQIGAILFAGCWIGRCWVSSGDQNLCRVPHSGGVNILDPSWGVVS